MEMAKEFFVKTSISSFRHCLVKWAKELAQHEGTSSFCHPRHFYAGIHLFLRQN